MNGSNSVKVASIESELVEVMQDFAAYANIHIDGILTTARGSKSKKLGRIKSRLAYLEQPDSLIDHGMLCLAGVLSKEVEDFYEMYFLQESDYVSELTKKGRRLRELVQKLEAQVENDKSAELVKLNKLVVELYQRLLRESRIQVFDDKIAACERLIELAAKIFYLSRSESREREAVIAELRDCFNEAEQLMWISYDDELGEQLREIIISVRDKQLLMSGEVVDITDVCGFKPVELIYSRVFSKFLGITEEQCIEILDKGGFKTTDEDRFLKSMHRENINYTVEADPRGVLAFITAADELGYVKPERISDVKLRREYSNTTKPGYYDLLFKQGDKLSELGTVCVHALNDKFVIGSDWDGAMVFGHVPYTIMMLTGPLQLDEDKKFSYCKPLNYYFKDIVWNHTIHLKSGEVLRVEGNVTVNADCPIDAEGDITIEGVGENAVLTLCSYSAMQPCIGGETRTGLSYGRWEEACYRCSSVTLKNVKVVCDSSNEAFSLGEYGSDGIPIFRVDSVSSIECPEYKHKRVMIQGPQYYEGSSKLTEKVIYELRDAHSNEGSTLRVETRECLDENTALSKADTAKAEMDKALQDLRSVLSGGASSREVEL